MKPTKVDNTRWGPVKWRKNTVTYPPEHPMEVASEAALMCTVLVSDLSPHDWNELLVAAMDFDHLPRDRRVWEVAVRCMAIAIQDGWADHLNWPTGDVGEEAQRATLRFEAEQLVLTWAEEDG